MSEGLITRLRKRAEIRRSISSRKSVQEGAPDRIADLLDEAADSITANTEATKGLVEALKKENARLREALEFYADCRYGEGDDIDELECPAGVMHMPGKVAREALAPAKEPRDK